MSYILSNNIYRSMRLTQWVVLICLVIDIAFGTWGCTSGRGSSVSAPLDTPVPSGTSIEPNLSSTSTPSAEPTPPPLDSGPEGSEATSEPRQVEPSLGLRGIWVHPKSVATRERADETLTRVQAGNFNAVFLLIFWYGYAHYDSTMAEKNPSLAPDYDPLDYVVAEAHRRGLQVHAWFVVGEIGTPYGEPGPVLSRYPEWSMVDASGGSQIHWLNFARPDARQFMSDLILETVENYDVDGVHLDYIRYPGSKWSFDAYSVNTLASEYGVNLESLRQAQLPAYGLFHGNPLIGVRTAEVLAKFDDGTPAVLLNTYGRGKVIVLNWHAEDQQIAAASEILRRSIEFLLGTDGDVYLFQSDTNEVEYTDTFFRENRAWLESVGWEPGQVTEEDLVALDTDSVLVMPNIYVMKASTAAGLAQFVENGGDLIFVDGPVRAMKYGDIRAITGMLSRGLYFKGERTLLAVGESELIPRGHQTTNLQTSDVFISRWNAFREESVTALVQDVYQRVKVKRPEVQVSAAVLRKQSWASDVFQDWYGWLTDRYVDFVVPMAYVGINETLSLETLVDEWQASGDLERTMAGLAVANFDSGDQEFRLKNLEQLVSEVMLIRRRGIKGVVIFDIETISDEQLKALANGPFALTSAL